MANSNFSKTTAKAGEAVSLKADKSGNFSGSGFNVQAKVSGPVQQNGYLASALQQSSAGSAVQMNEQIKQAAVEGVSGSSTSMPHLEAIQRSFGPHDVSNVQAHVGGAAAKANESMGAAAYATGNHVAFKAGPDLHTAAHEVAHVVQQRSGVQLSGGVGQVGDAYERHADSVADQVVQGKSAEAVLSQISRGTGIQTKTVQQVVQMNDECETGEPTPGSFDLGVSGRTPYDIFQDVGGAFSAGAASRLEKMEQSLEMFQTRVIEHAESPPGDALSAALLVIAEMAVGRYVKVVKLAGVAVLEAAQKVTGSLLTRSGEARGSNSRDRLLDFLETYRTADIQAQINIVAELEPSIRDDLDQEFEALGADSETPYSRGSQYVEGPQAEFIQTAICDGNAERQSAAELTIEALVQTLSEAWISAQTRSDRGGGLDSFAEVLSRGYIRLVFATQFEFTDTSADARPSGIRRNELEGAILRCSGAGGVIELLRNSMQPFDIWAIEVSKKVVVFEPGMGGPSIDVELDQANQVTQILDRVEMWETGPWQNYPVSAEQLESS